MMMANDPGIKSWNRFMNGSVQVGNKDVTVGDIYKSQIGGNTLSRLYYSFKVWGAFRPDRETVAAVQQTLKEAINDKNHPLGQEFKTCKTCMEKMQNTAVTQLNNPETKMQAVQALHMLQNSTKMAQKLDKIHFFANQSYHPDLQQITNNGKSIQEKLRHLTGSTDRINHTLGDIKRINYSEEDKRKGSVHTNTRELVKTFFATVPGLDKPITINDTDTIDTIQTHVDTFLKQQRSDFLTKPEKREQAIKNLENLHSALETGLARDRGW